MTREEAFALVTTDLELLLGVDVHAADADLVATHGGDLLDFESKVIGVISPARAVVDLF